MYYKTFDNTKVELKSVNDIYTIPNPDTVKILYLYNNNITYLDKDIFNNLINLQLLFLQNNKLTHLDKNIFKHLANLQYLDLSDNNISSLDNDIFNTLTNLQELYLYNNLLTHLDNDIFKHLTNLHKLYLDTNNLSHLDKDIFKNLTNLQELYLDYNKLTTLNKDIFKHLTNLHDLDLSNNNFTHLDKNIVKYLTNLHDLDLSYNNLTHLNNDIFNTLTNLQCLDLSDNNLTSLPSSITNCRHLNDIQYYNNAINYMPPNIKRFLNNLRQTSNKLQIYNDSQNVHNHHIQECIKTSLENILNYPKTIDKESLTNELLNSKINDRSLRLLLEYCQDESVHSVLNITFEEALLHVLEYINLELKDNRDDILNILETEILDSECKCFTGRISRLINCLNGYTPLVKVEIPDNMAISNIIVMVKNSYKSDNVDELKELVKTELLERGYALDTITEYIAYVDI
jgi:Leucine-rich repeat (LRR) protein